MSGARVVYKFCEVFRMWVPAVELRSFAFFAAKEKPATFRSPASPDVGLTLDG